MLYILHNDDDMQLTCTKVEEEDFDSWLKNVRGKHYPIFTDLIPNKYTAKTCYCIIRGESVVPREVTTYELPKQKV